MKATIVVKPRAMIKRALVFFFAVAASAATPDVSILKNLQWREVGPYRGGRADAVEGIPNQPDIYYFGSSGGGVWKTTDGGQTWKPVSDGYFGGTIGAIAVAASDTSVVYVGTGEETIRGNVSPGGGMWKSTDAGKTWTHIGLDDSYHIGRIRVHPTNPDLVYVAAMGHAFGPNDMRGVYRSKDGGKSWEKILFVSRDAGAVDLAMDPTNPRILYASTWRFRRGPYFFESGGEGSALWKSTDGGDTWRELSRNKGMPKGTLGIIGVSVSPTNSQNIYAIVEAKDGGVYRSRDGGDTWTKMSDHSDLRQRAWYYTRIYADPKDEDTAYIPNVRFHKSKDGGKTWSTISTPHGDNHDLWIAPNNPMGAGDADLKQRFQWNFPIFFSPNDPHKLYAASQYLMQSTNGGASWQTISPDLTRNDKSKMGPTGGPITKDNSSVEYYGTVFYGAESPVEPGVIWAGSDDGVVHITRDGGQHWENVTPPKSMMPEWIMINEIEASPFDKGAGYVAATMYKSDDFHPYLYKTIDYGKTWTKIVDGIPNNEFTRVIRSDNKKRGLLFSGTERGVYASFDDGAHWQSLQQKLPIVPIHDMLVHDDALIVATHGRGFWMLDDIEPLRQLAPDVATKSVHLFTPAPAWRMFSGGGFGGGGAARTEGTNPPNGVVVDFLIRDQKPGTKVSLAFLGPDGKVIRELKGEVQAEAPKPTELKGGAPPPPPAPTEAVKSEGSTAEREPSAETGAEAASEEEEGEFGRPRDSDRLTNITNGHNRVTWNLRTPEAKRFPGMVLWSGGTLGPRV